MIENNKKINKRKRFQELDQIQIDPPASQNTSFQMKKESSKSFRPAENSDVTIKKTPNANLTKYLSKFY